MASMTISPDPIHRIERPVMHMGWFDLAFLHWRLEPAELSRVLPDGVEPDLFDGSAWVGLIPFSMEAIRFPGLPVIPYVSRFPETNVRTYVRGPDGGEGIWFFSLDVNRLLPALVARGSYRLPYCWGPMSIERSGARIRYRGHRRWPAPAGPGSDVVVEVGDWIGPGDVDELEHWLTARWSLYSRFGSRILTAPVEHRRWPLRRARLIGLDQDIVQAAGLPAPAGDPHVLFSPGVRVQVGRPRPV
jgi:uncharacterized protein YqjF (DUF2071 family)